MPNTSSSAEGVRLAELLAVLSLGADLGMNQPMEHVLRQSLIALRLGELLGFDEAARAGLYHSSLIVWVGCHIDAYEQAKWFGDDLALKGDFRLIDATGTAPLKYVASHLGAGRPLLARARMGVRFVAGGHRDVDGMLANHWAAPQPPMSAAPGCRTTSAGSASPTRCGTRPLNCRRRRSSGYGCTRT